MNTSNIHISIFFKMKLEHIADSSVDEYARSLPSTDSRFTINNDLNGQEKRLMKQLLKL